MTIPLHPSQMGGGKVMRSFTYGPRRLRRGDVLTEQEVASMAHANRSALIDKGFLMVWPKDAQVNSSVAAVRYVVARGFGRYDVIEGAKVNDGFLDKQTAHMLAGIPLTDEKGEPQVN